MSIAMCMDDRMLIGILALFLAIGGACLASAIFATIGLAKWAAARHNRLAANAR